MKIETILTIITILQITVSITFAAQFENPKCIEPPRNDALSGYSALFIFMVGFGPKTEEVFYVLKQITCLLPTAMQIHAAVFPSGNKTIEIQGFTQFDELRDSLKTLAESNHETTESQFKEDIETLNNLNDTFEDFEHIYIIAHELPGYPELDFYSTFKNAQLDAKFNFALITFDNREISGLKARLNVDLNKVDVTRSNASEKLRVATRDFMDDILGRNRLPAPVSTSSAEPEPVTNPAPSAAALPNPTNPSNQGPNSAQATTQLASKSEGFPLMIIIIVAVVIVIIILLIICLVVFCICRKKKKNKKADEKKSKKKQKGNRKSKDVEKNANKQEDRKSGSAKSNPKTPGEKSAKNGDTKSAEPIAAASAESPAVATPSKEDSKKPEQVKSQNSASDELAFLKNKPREEKKKSTLSESLSLSEKDDSLAQQQKTVSILKTASKKA